MSPVAKRPAGVVSGLAEIAAGTSTPLNWTSSCFERIVRREPEVEAWAYLDRNGAVERAGGHIDEGPLKGLPIGVKDVIDVAGMPTGCNSPIEAGRVAADNAVAVQRLIDAGAIVLGKTVTTEYAFMAPGPTRNPLNPDHTPGGSSSGSAAAVADGHVPVALTTQTGGSTIRPAAYCGVVGYKPPFGTVPNDGLKLLAPSLDTIGLHARSVADIAAVASEMEARPRSVDHVAHPNFAIIHLPVEAAQNGVNARLMQDVAERLRKAGATVRELDAPDVFLEVDAAHRTLMSPQVARTFADIYRSQPDAFSDSLRDFIEQGQNTTDHAISQAHACVARAHMAVQSLITQSEILLCPAADGEALRGLYFTGSAVFCRPWTLLHYACMTVPAGTGPGGLPLGLQLVDPSPAGDSLFGPAGFAESVLSRTIIPGRTQ